MGRRFRRVHSPLMLLSAAPLALAGWLVPEQYAMLGQSTLLAAAAAAMVGLIRSVAAYVRYRQHRRRFRRVLAAEEAWRPHWPLAQRLSVHPRINVAAASTLSRHAAATPRTPVTTATA
ncbi:MAG: hypothetical protein ACODAQ_02445 [Phycisphaeraceae bacterium]